MAAQDTGEYPLIIAGGCYREICERPRWNAIFGSGARAAAALVGVAPRVELHTYCHPERVGRLDHIRIRGIDVHSSPSRNQISFAYLHPLSRPGVEPQLSNITVEEPIFCRGNVVLRFGFMEGDAVVHGDRVIYDPQTLYRPLAFRENGSSANYLSLVLNADELLESVPANTIAASAESIMARDEADVVAIKCGAKGAAVLEKGKDLCWIPAFRTPKVFKMGTGDVFTATFAHYWGVEQRPAIEAAILASRSTAAYCASRQLPIPIESKLPAYPPVSSNTQTRIGIIGSRSTLANHWLVEEAQWCLNQLGRPAQRINPALLEGAILTDGFAGVLILADTLDDGGASAIKNASVLQLPVIVLKEQGELAATLPPSVLTTNDFTTALYWSVWA